MAQISGTTDTLDINGIAEDIEDIIFNISPMDTPLLSMAKKVKVSNTYHQWQTDTLAAASGTNRQIEGDDASYTTANTTTVLGNYAQISRKTVIVSNTADVVKKYGRGAELARLVAKYGKELKRDIESSLLSNNASSAGGSSTARSSAGLESMITNYVKAGGSANTAHTTPGFAAGTWTAPTDGTTASVTEAQFLSAVQLAWTAGGDPSVVLAPPGLKKQFATFAGSNKFAGTYDVQKGSAQGLVLGGVDLYISDFGTHEIKLSRFSRSRTLFCLDPEYVSVGWLRPIQTMELAVTGDANKSMILGEYTLIVNAPDSHAKLADCV